MQEMQAFLDLWHSPEGIEPTMLKHRKRAIQIQDERDKMGTEDERIPFLCHNGFFTEYSVKKTKVVCC